MPVDTLLNTTVTAKSTISEQTATTVLIDPTRMRLEPTATTDTSTPAPTFAPLAPISVRYYRIRIKFISTSDWTTFDWLDSDILTARTIELTGKSESYSASRDHLSLNQSLANAEAGVSIGITVDYAIAPEALDFPLQFRLQKGDIGKCTVKIYSMTGVAPKLMQTLRHAGFVPNSDGLNPKVLEVDLSSLRNTQPLVAEIQRPWQYKMLFAFYYMWYSIGDWSTPWLKDHPIERYASNRRESIIEHIRQAQAAGIDGFVSSWWGPNSDTDTNLRLLLDIAQQMDFKVSIYFETLAGENGSPIEAPKIYEWLAYFIKQYGDHSALVKVNGKPLIVIWASDTVSLETWQGVFSSLREDGMPGVYLAIGYELGNLAVFDGLHQYGVFGYPDLEQVVMSTAQAVRYYSLLADQPSQKIWAATVQPGYDDTLLPGRQGLVQERLDGDYYRFTWETAIRSNPDIIFITTWNEWWENTHIEPGELYGDLYLQITQTYARLWKSDR